MNRKIKIIVLVVAILTVIAVAAGVGLKWYNNQEYVIVSKAFGVTIDKDADIIYFDDDDEYLHAAYGVSTEDYETLLDELLSNGFEECEIYTEIDGKYVNSPIMSNTEWIPLDRITKAYCLREDSKECKGYDYSYVYVADSDNGFVELYFIK